MADYHSPTGVQPTIPNADMTPLERLLLTRIFQVEPDGDGLYFLAETGPSDGFKLATEDLRVAFTQSAGIASTASAYFAKLIVDIGDTDTHIEIDLSGTSWEFIFQDIVRRSSTLDHLTVVSAFTCTKMRHDGFGGMVVLITADAIKGKSTNDILEDFLAKAQVDAHFVESHVLLQLDETSVRSEIGHLIETDGTLTTLTTDAVTDADIRAACRAVAEHTDLSEEQGSAVFRAALAAIREAERKRASSA